MLRLSNFSVPLDYTNDSLRRLLLKRLSLAPDQLLSFSLFRRSVDARDKGDVHFVLSLNLCVKNESILLKKYKNLICVHDESPRPLSAPHFTFPPLVVGAGPSGLFCALTLARAGANPILIERGQPVDQRTIDVDLMTSKGILDEESNVQFGEGGAGETGSSR